MKGHYKRLCDEEPTSMLDDEEGANMGLDDLQADLSQF